jgi:radical SAM superfamily enzyme YgiQ (UPF0313 family)
VKICFIPPASIDGREWGIAETPGIGNRFSERPPLGILTLASILVRRGFEVELLDLDHLLRESSTCDNRRSMCEVFERAAGELRLSSADVFGFGTLAGSYPLAVRLAAEIKRAKPAALVVFGGPQATAVDVASLEAFPFIDIIVRGEAELTLVDLVESLGNLERLNQLQGITFRHNGRAVRVPDRVDLPNLDELPEPAFDLWPLMPKLKSVPLEVGRGCPYSCTFCSTSHFFRRRYRCKEPFRVIDQMRSVLRRYGVSSFVLLHDAFTVDRAKVFAFCDALERTSEEFRWTCSARTDCVDEELLERMASAGCNGIFFGIESGADRTQQAIRKRLDLEEARSVIQSASASGMKTAVSMIVGFPDETRDEVRATTDFLMDSARHDRVVTQLHLLAPLAGTELYRQYKDYLKWDGTSSDIASRAWPLTPADESLILAHPQLFPDFYWIPTTGLDRRRLVCAHQFLASVTSNFRWLAVSLHQYCGSLFYVFESWVAWRSHCPQGTSDIEQYYGSADFGRDFLEFTKCQYLTGQEDPEALAVAVLWTYQRQLACFKRTMESASAAGHAAFSADSLAAIPNVAPGVTPIHLPADYGSIIDCLRRKASPRDVVLHPNMVAHRSTFDGCAEVIQLTPLAAALLQFCDGTHKVEEIAVVFPKLDADLAGMPPEPACLFALNELARQGLVTFTPA